MAPITREHRLEAEALKSQYQQTLRLLQGKPTGVRNLINLIVKETGKNVDLTADYWFFGHGNAPQQDVEFEKYVTELYTVINECTGMTEYSNWALRYRDFRRVCPDFQMYAVLKKDSAELPEAASTSVTKQGTNKTYEITSNDRRFLRSLRIASEQSDDGPVE